MDVVPDEVLPGVFIGPKEAAYNRETLRRLGITRVIICCDCIPAYHEEDPTIFYLRIPIKDSLFQNLTAFLPTAMAFIAESSEKGEGCLVHCNAGVSRSGSIIVAYIRRTLKLSLEDSLAFAKSKRPIIHPNSNFLEQLALEKTL